MATALSRRALRHRSSGWPWRRFVLGTVPPGQPSSVVGGCWSSDSLMAASNPTPAATGVLAAPSPAVSRRWFVSATPPRCEKKTIVVPTMGDSITEGTIVEWTAQVGQAVQADDVVALIETDKVTVEIKVTTSGVITQHFGAVDDTVEVGAKLYEIDTEGEATVVSAPSSSDDGEAFSESTVDEAPEEPGAAVQDHQHQARTPSIHFLQKDGWAKRKAGVQPTPPAADLPAASSLPPQASSPLAVMSYTVDAVPPMYGRPMFTEAEIDALMYGGANLVS